MNYIFLVSPYRKFLIWRLQGSFPVLSVKKLLLSVVDCCIKDLQQWHRSISMPSHNDSILSCMTCFSQWHISKHDTCRILKGCKHWDLPSLLLLGTLSPPCEKAWTSFLERVSRCPSLSSWGPNTWDLLTPHGAETSHPSWAHPDLSPHWIVGQ